MILVLGTFDGMHAGHRALFTRAREIGGAVVAYTFRNSPKAFFDGDPVSLMTFDEKLSALSALSDDVIAVEFDSAYADATPEDFARTLKESYGAEYVVVGYNYTFGRGAKGTPELLKSLGEQYGFECVIVPPVMFEGESISSTRIKNAIASGDFLSANSMLGYEFRYKGEVMRGRQVGRQLGFPTVNIFNENNRPMPVYGVYAAKVYCDGRILFGMANVGVHPTFEESRPVIETHIFDFDEDLYGKRIEVALLKFIRSERKFSSVEALIKQMRIDENKIRLLNGIS